MFRPRLCLLLVALLAFPNVVRGASVAVGGADVRFGDSVSDAGDVNGDGRPDFLVGAPLDDTPGQENGRAYLWLAREGGFSSIPDLVLSGGSGTLRHFGWNVAGIGDVNDDGFDDFAVGAPGDDFVGTDAGAVFVYFGGATPDGTPDLTLRGETGDDQFGYWVSRGGDLNGDARDDFLVGAPYADPIAVGQDAGSVYLFRGASGTPSTTAAVRFDGEVAGDHFGWCVAEVPNFRGNGVASFIVGSPGFGFDQGKAYLYYGGIGGALPNTTVDVSLTGGDGDDFMGFSLSSIGDFSGDGRSDVAVGAPGYLGDRGSVRVWYGAANPAATPAWTFELSGGTGGDRFGEAVSGIGDADGSSHEDMAVGAPQQDDVAQNAGMVYLVRGGATYSSVADAGVIAYMPESPAGVAFDGDQFGAAVCGLGGDMDSDGSQDFLAGAPGANNALNVASGAAALLSSGPGIVPVAEIPFATLPAGGQTELRFGGFAVSAERAELWSVEIASRLLAPDADFVRDLDMLSVTLSNDALAGAREVELRLWHDGVESSSKFQLPAITSVSLRLFEPAPNPFNPRTELRFVLPARAAYSLTIVDSRGRLLRELASGVGGPGELRFEFDGRDAHGARLASGSYRAVLRSGGQIRAQGLTLVE